ncbi:MAG: hypothetical protein ACRD3R_02715, partial [Terriglobales bacterium]
MSVDSKKTASRSGTSLGGGGPPVGRYGAANGGSSAASRPHEDQRYLVGGISTEPSASLFLLLRNNSNVNGYYWHEQVLPYIKNETSLLCKDSG